MKTILKTVADKAKNIAIGVVQNPIVQKVAETAVSKLLKKHGIGGVGGALATVVLEQLIKTVG